MVGLNPRRPLACYAARTKSQTLLLASISGGAFTELANVILSQGGIVFGAAWEKESFRVVHKWVDNEIDLTELRGSKYSTSDMSNVYTDIKNFLESGRLVLFTGTPCQIAAIGKCFGSRPNLILCALICMANVHSSLWLDYVSKLQERVGSKLIRIEHRHKNKDREGALFYAEFQDASKTFTESLYDNEYWQMFVKSAKPCCLACEFKSGRHPADLVIGDFWKLNKFMPNLKWDNGASAVLVYSQKGEALLNQTGLEIHKATYEQVLFGNPYLEKTYIPFVERKCSFYARLRGKVGAVLIRCREGVL